MSRKTLLLLSLLVALSAYSLSLTHYNQNNFQQAKVVAAKINADAPADFTAAAKSAGTVKGVPDLSSCGYSVRKNANRAERIEWEHVMPAWEFGHQRQCWQNGGRKNCSKDADYRRIESDLHNLQPAIGEVNGDRNNFQYSQWNGDEQQYGQCSMKIDFKQKRAEPPERARRHRPHLLLYARPVSSAPVTPANPAVHRVEQAVSGHAVECERDQRIATVQGNHNSSVQQACQR